MQPQGPPLLRADSDGQGATMLQSSSFIALKEDYVASPGGAHPCESTPDAIEEMTSALSNPPACHLFDRAP